MSLRNFTPKELVEFKGNKRGIFTNQKLEGLKTVCEEYK